MKSPNTSKEGFKEDFLHYIWKFQYFSKVQLRTHQKEDLVVLSPGFLNSDAGPDFKQAKITLNGIEWHGHIEIHYKSSDWDIHHHSTDPAYNTVILHVVWDNNKPSKRKDGSLLPVLELKGRVERSLIETYSSLVQNNNSIPCASFLQRINGIHLVSMLERSLIERLENKSMEILNIYSTTKNNWEETAFRWIGKCYGFKLNSAPFLKLCEALPYSLLKKYRHNSLQVEALLFGFAGFLEHGYEDPYPVSLQKEFHYLRQKHPDVHGLTLSEWKFLRLRPANFPTLRIAQFSSFLLSAPHLVELVFHPTSSQEFRSHCTRNVHSFWEQHYHFNTSSSGNRNKIHLGKSSAENIELNALLPLRFAFAHFNGMAEMKTQVTDSMRILKAEKNSILDLFGSLGIRIDSAYETQAILQLHQHYCTKKKCLSCQIGHQIMYSS